jgi:hypothetical protein
VAEENCWPPGNEAVVIEMAMDAWVGEDGEEITAGSLRLGRALGFDSAAG